MGSEHVTIFSGSETIEVKLAGEQLESTLTVLQTFVGIGLPHVGGTIDGATIGATTPPQAQTYPPVNAQTGTTYTLALTDLGKLVTLSNASAVTLTVPPNSSVAFPVGATIPIAQIGAGLVTVAAGAGVTVHQVAGSLALLGQYSAATLRQVAANVWVLNGDVAA